LYIEAYKISISKKLRQQLEETTNDLCVLIGEIPIKHYYNYNPNVIVIYPDFYWDERTPIQDKTQLKIKRRYDSFSELLSLLLQNAPRNLSERLQTADESFRVWLELSKNWSLSSEPDENEKHLRCASLELEQLIDVLESDANQEVFLIPDTNSLLVSSDPSLYCSIAETKSFTFLLLPTVLAELDSLKILHRNPDVREKAEKAIKRIKGWRNQGALTQGVKVNRNMRILAESREPDMKNTLSWLDSDISDDRILASTLSVITNNPTAKVVLVTNDINLQNKADAAMIDVSELDLE